MNTFDFTCLDQYLLGLSFWCFHILIPSSFYLFQLNEQLEILGKDEADPKAREIFHEASRTLEMANPDDLQALGETMFQG